ncbi:GATA-binding factor 5-A [Wickerhamomyces ciferrii]|uniref:GATA-binding factor 5-A n=1 Tax=Wickerhamomyces ciferrii (strain ATCC 14091 / BCRC 22168 / CBS 111 / JCM 3599 / NBRC 0793 / NRRL Y-1031 F-60-10) TaxID=1206466 RepID=K0KWF4_WICCF|nr:GATA-binding factor 5-A [Wickerhamomyces ciferrii]CCH45824.1 GATA-binding factor 5-A [Wickerhamomyces ciferrii]
MTKCSNCEVDKTPMWRKTFDNDTKEVITLCNACGIYYKTKNCHRPRLLISKKNSLSVGELFDKLSNEQKDDSIVIKNDLKLEDLNIIRCSNCDNINTSIWRRDQQGNSICNACGLFYKKKGYHRSIKKSNNNDDVFFSIDENLIRFNKIKKRKRSSSSSDYNITKQSKKRSKSLSSNDQLKSNDTSPKTPNLQLSTITSQQSDDCAISSSSSSRKNSITSPQPIQLISNQSRSLSYSSTTSSSSSNTSTPQFNSNYILNSHILPTLHPGDNSYTTTTNNTIEYQTIRKSSNIKLPPISTILNININQ